MKQLLDKERIEKNPEDYFCTFTPEIGNNEPRSFQAFLRDINAWTAKKQYKREQAQQVKQQYAFKPTICQKSVKIANQQKIN